MLPRLLHLVGLETAVLLPPPVSCPLGHAQRISQRAPAELREATVAEEADGLRSRDEFGRSDRHARRHALRPGLNIGRAAHPGVSTIPLTDRDDSCLLATTL
jgi:hypothetical protein